MFFWRKLLLSVLLIFLSIQEASAQEKKELLFYIGITMVKPISELAEKFEKQYNCTIKILQGGSKDLYESIKSSQTGDIYFPGSTSYRDKYLKDGLLLNGQFVGYNKIALVVKKGNPLNIKADLSELTNYEYRTVLGTETSGSIGKKTKQVLLDFGNYREAMLHTVYLAPDSRNLNTAVIKNDADLILNWYATTFWEENKPHIEGILIDDKYAKKSKLVLNLLKTSKNKALVQKFMDYAASEEGKDTFEKYGFLTKQERVNFDKVSF
jgi:molybdate transport system substrate-binding protein